MSKVHVRTTAPPERRKLHRFKRQRNNQVNACHARIILRSASSAPGRISTWTCAAWCIRTRRRRRCRCRWRAPRPAAGAATAKGTRISLACAPGMSANRYAR